MMTAKPSMMATRSKYGNSRKLLDGAHSEAEDLWSYSQSRMHPGANDKASIANFVTLGMRKNMESLPYNTFRSGRIPYTFSTMSIGDNSEPTSAPSNQLLTPLEFAALGRMAHMLPSDFVRDTQNKTFSSGRDDIARYGKARKYKTSYAKPIKSVPYQRSDIASSSLNTSAAAQATQVENKALAGTETAGTDALASAQPHIIRLAAKLIAQFSGLGPKVLWNDPDILALVKIGITSTALVNALSALPMIKGSAFMKPILQMAAATIDVALKTAGKAQAESIRKAKAAGTA